ncbi:sulfatase-like hydrolase/transferase [Acinetobacter indicus]|uniref:sulfatase-like hydrolase/transferase n=1 Tax=Acinetobacter indicus TaxID=756892 RepID=UPI001444011A|nr:sulfatase-like hydrolase/transferase [Acinetobacter indicus]
MGGIAFFILVNIIILITCEVFGLHRTFFNLDYLICLFLIYFAHRKTAVIFFIILYSIDLLLLVRQIFPFFKFEDIVYILKFILLASQNYQLYFVMLLGFAIFFAYFLYKVKAKQQPLIYCFLVIAFCFAIQNLYFPKNKKYIDSQIVQFIEIRFDGFVQTLDVAQYILKKFKPTSATATLYEQPEQYAERKENILFIISESLGAPKNQGVLQRLLLPLQKNGQISDFKVSQVSYNMPTMYAEFRELCAMQLESFNLKQVQSSFSDCLPNIYHLQGYDTTAVHAALGVMYDRKDWYPSVGFKQMLFYEHKNWTRRCYSFSGGCDIELADDVTALLKKSKQFVYWLTLNSHAPYDSRDIINDVFPCEKFGIESKSEVCRNFKIHAQFFETLAGILSKPDIQPTTVVIVGDHTPTIFQLEDKEKYLNGNDVLVMQFKLK